MEVVREQITASARVLERSMRCNSECNVIVPDRNPDILKILHVDATCSIVKKTLTNGRISFEGKVFADVIYLPDGEDSGVKTLPTVFEFNDIIDSPEIKDDMCIKLMCDIEQLDINLINSRKISLKAIVSVDCELFENREIEYITSVNSTDAAYKCNEVNLYRMLTNDECEFLIKEQLELGNCQNLEVIKCDASVTDKEVRIAGNKVIVKGIVAVTVLYCDENNSIKNTDARFPFTEVFEVSGIEETDSVEVGCVIVEKSCQKGTGSNGENYINIEILVRAEIMVRRDERICCLCDCYCFGAETKCNSDVIKTERIITLPSAVKSIREVITADSRMPQIATVYNVVAKPRIVSTEKNDNTVTANSVLDVSVLYLSDNSENPVCCRKAEIPVMHTFDIKEAGELMITAECEHISYTLTGAGDVEIRAAVEFNTSNRMEKDINMIREIERGEETGTNQLIIFFAKGGESVWEIAKEYKTDPTMVAELNNIDEGLPVEKGKRLIIPTM
ncbi:MAG: DUF3794 domain-containing protein [Clostridia bacterium]|nr:DUF3794 domain-containing protein [Clostridia bacterium]